LTKEELYSAEEAMSAKDREQHYNEKVSQLVQYAYENSPEVKERLDKAGVKPSQIRTTRDLELIPFLSRDGLIERQGQSPPFGGLLAIPMDSLYKVLYSPGPFYIPVPSLEYARPALKFLHAAGLRKGDPVICSLPSLFAAGATIEDALSLAEMVAIPAGAGNTELQINMIHDLGIKGYVGTPSFLMNLVKKADELGYDFRKEFQLRSAVVSAEPLLTEVRNTLWQDYGIRATNALGIGTATWLGFECREQAGFHMLEEAFVEIVDPETGKQLESGDVGAMVVTSLNDNPAFPIVRYMTGDLSAFKEEPCSCGRTSKRLMGIMGRVGDSVKVRALYLTPAQVNTVASRFSVISRCQVVIGREGYRDEMVFNIELTDDTLDREQLSSELQSSFQDACRLRIDKINFVPKGTIPEGYKTIVDERSWDVRR